MDLLKKRPKFAPVTFPKAKPIKDSEDCHKSKQFCKLKVKRPNFDSVQITAIKLNQWMRRLAIANKQLERARIISSEKQVTFEHQWKKLDEQKTLLRESTISFNTFVRENMEKRDRAEKKITEEKLLQDNRRRDLHALKHQMERMLDVKKAFEKNIRAFRVYENFLQTIVMTGEFKDAGKIMQRFEALQEARNTSYEKTEKDMQLIEETQQNLQKLSEENMFTMMGLTNRMSDLQTRFGYALKRSLEWETCLTQVKDSCVQVIWEMDDLRWSAWGLCEIMARRKVQPLRLKRSDYETQLMYVSHTLWEMDKIMGGLLKKQPGRGKKERPVSPI